MEKNHSEEHNAELRLLTRESIFQALFLLMEKQEFKKISITDIVQRAGVSRMAYYRNFSSKEDILNTFLDSQFQRYTDSLDADPDLSFYELYQSFFAAFRGNSEWLKLLDKSNLTYLILERFTVYLHTILKDYFAPVEQSTSDYELAFAAGGLYNLLMKWSRGGMRESDEEMAKLAIKIGWPQYSLSDTDPYSKISDWDPGEET